MISRSAVYSTGLTTSLVNKYDAKRELGAFRLISLAFAASVRRKGKYRFILDLPPKAAVLDVGCGNNSPLVCRALRPDIFYVGVDIASDSQLGQVEAFADEYVVTARDRFWQPIERMPKRFDAAISSHNLEHCDQPAETLCALLRAIKPGGRVYLSFPCQASVSFPRRRGTLNFYDDPTHSNCPDLARVLRTLQAEGFETEFVAERYRPKLLAAVGLLLEPLSVLLRRTMPLGSTWALYGFESVIWARRTGSTKPSSTC